MLLGAIALVLGAVGFLSSAARDRRGVPAGGMTAGRTRAHRLLADVRTVSRSRRCWPTSPGSAGSEGYYELATRRSHPHGREVARVVDRVGRRLGLPEGGLRQLYLAGLFHEIGTFLRPAGRAAQARPADHEEFATLRPHPLVGERLLGGLPGLGDAAAIVRAERERFDGRGYPYGLAGEEIPLSAGILHARDAFVAMTTPRRTGGQCRRTSRWGSCAGMPPGSSIRWWSNALGGFVTERH